MTIAPSFDPISSADERPNSTADSQGTPNEASPLSFAGYMSQALYGRSSNPPGSDSYQLARDRDVRKEPEKKPARAARSEDNSRSRNEVASSDAKETRRKRDELVGTMSSAALVVASAAPPPPPAGDDSSDAASKDAEPKAAPDGAPASAITTLELVPGDSEQTSAPATSLVANGAPDSGEPSDTPTEPETQAIPGVVAASEAATGDNTGREPTADLADQRQSKPGLFRHGMADAQLPLPMKSAQKAGQTQPGAEQKLPLGNFAGAMRASSEQEPASRPLVNRPPVKLPEGDNSLALASSGFKPMMTSLAEAPAPIVPAEQPQAFSQVPQLESLARMVLDHAATLKQMTESSLEIVLRADAQTQMRLEMHVTGTETHVRAELQQGDGGLLAAHWSELQDSLARQGIKLAPLTEARARSGPNTGSNHAGLGGQTRREYRNHDSFSRESAEDSKPGPARVGKFDNSKTARSPKARTPLKRWETWA